MTREELRKKRKEIAESNGYQGYVPRSQKEGTRQEVRQTNQQPVQENKSTWQKITDRVNTIANSTPGRFVRKEIQAGNTVRKAMTNPTKAVADIGGNLLNKKIGDNTEYVAKKTGAGLVSGVTGIGSSFVTDTANQLKKGEKQSTYGTVMNAVNTLLAPDTTNIMKGTQQTIKGNIDILKDKDKNAWQKIAGVGQNTVSGAVNTLPLKQKTNAVIQAVGNILKGSGDKALQLNETINKPSQAINNALAEESQKYGMPTQLVGDAMQSVGNMLPSIATTMVTGDPTARSICYGTRC